MLSILVLLLLLAWRGLSSLPCPLFIRSLVKAALAIGLAYPRRGARDGFMEAFHSSHSSYTSSNSPTAYLNAS